jgi:hypothetical protein
MRLKNDPLFEQDLVLIHIKDKPAFYARVEEITADVKPKWWQVKLLILTLPLNVVRWIIDNEQIRGAEFTMGGIPIRIEKVVPPKETEEAAEDIEQKRSEAEREETEPKKARVLSLRSNKNKK